MDNLIGDRIQLIIDNKFDGNTRSFEQFFGIGFDVSRKWLKTSTPAYKYIFLLCNNPEMKINPKWLITGEGDMIEGNGNESAPNGLKMTENEDTITISKREYAMLNDFWSLANTLQKEKEQQIEKNVVSSANTSIPTAGAEYSGNCKEKLSLKTKTL